MSDLDGYSYRSGGDSPGVTPARDRNAPTPAYDADDPMQKPDFLREWEVELVAVRKKLSVMWADHYGVKYGAKSSDIPYGPYGQEKDMNIAGIERDAEYQAYRNKLEERESELQHLINTYKYVASLGDAPAEEDVAGEGDDTNGVVNTVGSR